MNPRNKRKDLSIQTCLYNLLGKSIKEKILPAEFEEKENISNYDEIRLYAGFNLYLYTVIANYFGGLPKLAVKHTIDNILQDYEGVYRVDVESPTPNCTHAILFIIYDGRIFIDDPIHSSIFECIEDITSVYSILSIQEVSRYEKEKYNPLVHPYIEKLKSNDCPDFFCRNYFSQICTSQCDKCNFEQKN